MLTISFSMPISWGRWEENAKGRPIDAVKANNAGDCWITHKKITTESEEISWVFYHHKIDGESSIK